MSATLRVRPSDRQSPQVRPPIRVLPAPRLEPPTDQERADAGLDASPSDHTAPALPLPPLTAPPTHRGRGHHTPETPAQPRSVDRPGSVDRPRSDRPGDAELGGPADQAVAPNVPAAKAAVHRFVAVCLEVIGGYRPPTHLRPLCAPGELAEVVRQLTGRATTLGAGAAPIPSTALGGRGRSGPGAVGSRTPVMTRAATGAPARSPRQAPVAPHDRTAIRRVLITEPAPGVAEVVVLLDRRQRTLAMTLRMELRGDRWACTHLRVL